MHSRVPRDYTKVEIGFSSAINPNWKFHTGLWEAGKQMGLGKMTWNEGHTFEGQELILRALISVRDLTLAIIFGP